MIFHGLEEDDPDHPRIIRNEPGIGLWQMSKPVEIRRYTSILE
jgi:hypothetical protein